MIIKEKKARALCIGQYLGTQVSQLVNALFASFFFSQLRVFVWRIFAPCSLQKDLSSVNHWAVLLF